MECPTPKRTIEEEGEDNKENPNHNISNSFSIFLDETLLNTYWPLITNYFSLFTSVSLEDLIGVQMDHFYWSQQQGIKKALILKLGLVFTCSEEVTSPILVSASQLMASLLCVSDSALSSSRRIPTPKTVSICLIFLIKWSLLWLPLTPSCCSALKALFLWSWSQTSSETSILPPWLISVGLVPKWLVSVLLMVIVLSWFSRKMNLVMNFLLKVFKNLGKLINSSLRIWWRIKKINVPWL